jgi:hypothetical protein
MKPSTLCQALLALIGERVPLHIWGACGVGKSQIVAQVADEVGYDFLDVRAVQLDPVDLRALLRISSDFTEWVPLKFLPSSGKGILFLDELTSAPRLRTSSIAEITLKIEQYDRRIQQLGQAKYPETQALLRVSDPRHYEVVDESRRHRVGISAVVSVVLQHGSRARRAGKEP